MSNALLVYGITSDLDPSTVATCQGVDGRPIELICSGGLSAVVSSYRPDDTVGRPVGTPIERPAADAILAWHRILDAVYGHAPVLPTHYGMVASSRDEVVSLLTKSGPWLRRRLDYLGDKGEFDVSLSWNSKAVANDVAEQLDDVRALRARGQALTQAEALQAGRRVFEAVEARRATLASQWRGPLSELASQIRELGRGPDLVLCAAFLVERPLFQRFEQRVAEIAGGCDPSLKGKYAGPMPPYSFVGLSLVVLTSERVEWARTLLHIGAEASVAEIRRAYRQTAVKCHPDLHPNDPGAIQRFRDMESAYRYLLGLASTYTSDDVTQFPVKHEAGACCAVAAVEAE